MNQEEWKEKGGRHADLLKKRLFGPGLSEQEVEECQRLKEELLKALTDEFPPKPTPIVKKKDGHSADG